MTNSNFDFYILEAINNAIKTVKASPVILGGVASTGGGTGGPPGGFVGKLTQTRVTYDESEAATDFTPVSGSLLDNLNHIRYRIQVLESGGTPGSMSVYSSGVLVGSGITILDFGDNLTVTDLGGGHVLINSTASGVASGGALTFLDLIDTPATYSGQANKLLIVNGTETGITFVTASGGGDMMKSIYDTDDDGIIDQAESVPWSGITGKPSTFPPDSHTHDHTLLTNLNTTDYYHLTAVQYSGLTDGGVTLLHTHSGLTASGFVSHVQQYNDDAGWCWFSDPRTLYYNGKTYTGYIKSNGDVAIKSFNHITQTFSTETILHAALEVDDHDNPSIIIRDSDKKIMVFYSTHDGNDKVIRYRISTNAEDVSSFDTEVTIDPGSTATRYSYTNPVQLLGETNDPIYLFYRRHDTSYGNQRLAYTKSTNGGSTWSAESFITDVTYHKVAQNGDSRIDFAQSEHPGDAGTHKIYHFYYQGGKYYKTDGTEITASTPLSGSNLTTVYDGTTTNCWVWDIAIEPATGYPIIVFVTLQTISDFRYKYARWNGSSWDITQIAIDTGGTIDGSGTEGYYAGGISLDRNDTGIVYLIIKTGGQFELYRGKTNDNGATWVLTQVTSNSIGKQIRPATVRNSVPDLAVLWLNGTYTSYTNYDLSLMMLGEWEPRDTVTSSGIIPSGSDTFLELTDTPVSYSGYAGKSVVVNDLETGLAFVLKELLMEDGVTAPPVPLESETRDDWLYGG